MKSIILCVLLIFGTACAGRDWSKIKTIVAPGFEEQHSHVNPRIVGGNEAAPHSLPYQAALFVEVKQGTAFCGGSLISKKYILTAAHCVDKALQVEVVLGAHKIREDEPTQISYNASNIFVHKGWNPFKLVNDIALIELPEEVTLSDHIQLIGLPTYSEAGKSFNGKTVKASGWGKDSDKSSSISPVLRNVDVKVISNTMCNLRYFGIIQSTHICTSGKGGKSTCSGDSGGPLVIENDKQIGVVSFGIAFGCEIGWPAAFTRVSRYLDWIAANTDVEIQK